MYKCNLKNCFLFCFWKLKGNFKWSCACVCNLSVYRFDKMRAVCVSHLIDPHPRRISTASQFSALDSSYFTAPRSEFIDVLTTPAPTL